MLKTLLLVVTLFLSFLGTASAEKIKCQDSISSADVIAEDQDADGNVVSYKRTQQDIEKIITVLKARILKDPAMKNEAGWQDKMLTVNYWAKERCGGTKNCSTKECSSGKSCVYRSLGMSGCRCE